MKSILFGELFLRMDSKLSREKKRKLLQDNDWVKNGRTYLTVFSSWNIMSFFFFFLLRNKIFPFLSMYFIGVLFKCMF